MPFQDLQASHSAIADRRFLVLVPLELKEYARFANKVRLMALQNQDQIFYITLVGKEEDCLTAERMMVILEAITAITWSRSIRKPLKPKVGSKLSSIFTSQEISLLAQMA